MEWHFLNHVIDALYGFIRWVAGTVNGLPLSHLGGVYVTTFGVIAYFVVMALVMMWLYRRHFSYLLAAACALAVLLGHSIWVDAHSSLRGVIIFNSFSSTPLLYYDHGKGYVSSRD